MILEFLELLELFWIFFGTGNEPEKILFLRLALEFFLEFRISHNQLFRLQHF